MKKGKKENPNRNKLGMLTIHPGNCSEGMAKAQKVYTVANLPCISSTDTKLKILYCTA